MTPALIDLTIYQGATFRKSLQWKTGKPATAVDLNGYTARMQVRQKLADTAVVIELTTENGGIAITSPSEGKLALFISDTDTAALAIRSGVYDLELIDAGGDVSRLAEGSVTVSPEVTR